MLGEKTKGSQNMKNRFLSWAILLLSLIVLYWWPVGTLRAQEPATAPESGTAPTVLFIGNSFTYGAGSPVRFYRAQTVTDLNGEGTGGVPALFKMFAVQAGRDFRVSLETAGGKNFDYHVKNKAAVIGRAWDYVVAQ